jgi:serine/threonine protein kinase
MEDLLNGCYRKYRKIGEGSSGKVYLAEEVSAQQNENSISGANNHDNGKESQKPSKRYMALKKMKLGKAQPYELINEYQLMSQFKCSNLMKM